METKKEREINRSGFLYEHLLGPAYIRRESSVKSRSDWERIRSNASTIHCEHLHPLFLLVVISAHVTKHAADFAEETKR